MSVSIIVPVLDEAPQIQAFLLHIKDRAPEAEVIVVDGGSSDNTVRLAQTLCDHVIQGRRGRPLQMNLGAQYASGDILWFLHSDSEIPENSIEIIERELFNREVVGGCFRIRLLKEEWIYRIHDGVAHYVGMMLRVRCGDHGLFARRSAFDAVDGYPNIPIMEDVEFFRAIQRIGKVVWLPSRLIISYRRHQQIGIYRYTFICALIVALHCLGAKPDFLSRLYVSLVPLRNDTDRVSVLAPVEEEIFSKFRKS